MKIFWILLLVFTTGCAAYRPKPVIPQQFYVKQASQELSSDGWLVKYNALPEATPAEQGAKAVERNRLLNELILVVDSSYEKFESSFYGEFAVGDIASDFLQLGLSGAGVISNGDRAKTILAAVATATAGGKTSIDANWYDKQSRSAIVAKMRASRLSQLAVLESRMTNSLTGYTMEDGLRDVQVYYSEGTVSSALQEITMDASQQSNNAKLSLKALRR